MLSSFRVLALVSTALLVNSLPASAQVVRFDPSLATTVAPSITPVQFGGAGSPGRGGVQRRVFGGGGGGFNGGGQRRFGGGGGGGFRRGFGGGGGVFRPGYGGGYRHGYRGGGRGAAIGAGVAGLAAGALIGGALASQPGYGYGYGYDAPVYADPGYGVAPAPMTAGDASAYCSQRFKSYDPASGTYLGYDGQRHPCP